MFALYAPLDPTMMAPYRQPVQPAFDARTGVYRTTHDDDRPWSASTTVVLALAEVTGIEPTDMLPLAGTVDPDALDSHVRYNDNDIAVSFEFHGYDVTVRGDGLIELEPADGQEVESHDRPQSDHQRTWNSDSCE